MGKQQIRRLFIRSMTAETVLHPNYTEVEEHFLDAGSDLKNARQFFYYYHSMRWLMDLTTREDWEKIANKWIETSHIKNIEYAKL